jgi:hypothetical protein
MKQMQLEIILITDTRFSSRQFCGKYGISNQNNSSKNKRLEETCWNGPFKELLPELYTNAGDKKKLTLWKMVKGEHFLDLEYGKQP